MKKLRILIVDDNQDFAESMSDVLELEGYKVEIALNGEDAVKIFREQDFDITFMDVKLPGKNGVESYREIRKFKPDSRVVMMTGYSVENLLDQAVKEGAWDVLHKPLEMDNVLQMLSKVKPDGILIADDEPDFIETIKQILVINGYKVFTAYNGKEAVDKIKKNSIDVLILDLQMPVLNGLDTYLELKRLKIAVPTIIVTAFAKEESDTLNRLRSLSITGILNKPFEPKELLQVLESLISTEEDA